MNYEKINLSEREDAFKKKLDSIFDIINTWISIACNGGESTQAHSGLSELEALGYKSIKELLYYSNKSILTLESVVANNIKLVNDIMKDVCSKIIDNYVYHFNMDITTIQTPEVCLEDLKKYLVKKVIAKYSISYDIHREANEIALYKAINTNLIGYSFDFAYDKQKNHLVLVALTEYQKYDIEREEYGRLGVAGFKLKTPHHIDGCSRHIMDS